MAQPSQRTSSAYATAARLKQEFVHGDLRDPKRAALPIGGVVVPALVFGVVGQKVGDGCADGVEAGWLFRSEAPAPGRCV
ncbi:Na+/H+ antiporter NhaA [Streptomyces olivaceus]|uniref:Na+/H+ antiporter NhaA n=1 Tax=Streptomyces olivaceus TaxID=47716 RepID=UPI00371D3223